MLVPSVPWLIQDMQLSYSPSGLIFCSTQQQPHQAPLPAYMSQQQLAPAQFSAFPAQVPTVTAQATTLPQAFHTMTPHDPS
ncbi:hypothetical protein Tco_1557865 [Tanacetum coccineum]